MDTSKNRGVNRWTMQYTGPVSMESSTTLCGVEDYFLLFLLDSGKNNCRAVT